MGVQEFKVLAASSLFTFASADQLLSPPAKDMALVLKYRRSRASHTVDETKVLHPDLELHLTSGKGLGLFVTRNIKRGTCILSETPLVVLSSIDEPSYRDLQRQLAKLSLEQRDIFHSLYSGHEDPSKALVKSIRHEAMITRRPLRNDAHMKMEARKIVTFKTNATRMPPTSLFGVFPLFSRINHSCTPNVYASYNATLRKHTVYATRHIKAGEELLVSYINPVQDKDDRATDLKKFNFKCKCPSCPSSKALTPSDEHRYAIQQIQLSLAFHDGTADPKFKRPEVVPTSPDFALHMAETAINLMHQEGLITMDLAHLHRQASQYSLRLGKVVEAKAHAEKEADIEKVCLGADTSYLNDKDGGNAATWMKEVEKVFEKDRVKYRACEKRMEREVKRAQKKAEKKAAKKGRG